ncbi:hypothetical protein J6590_010964 [Homalodisca vitripennis]|nr:hypothetical protein J6590_010964 [Homalodisca vitripennis]
MRLFEAGLFKTNQSLTILKQTSFVNHPNWLCITDPHLTDWDYINFAKTLSRQRDGIETALASATTLLTDRTHTYVISENKGRLLVRFRGSRQWPGSVTCEHNVERKWSCLVLLYNYY